MRVRKLLSVSALAVAAVLAAGVPAASGALLFTTAAHTTRVTVGATADLTAVAPFTMTSGAVLVDSCPASTLHVVLIQNAAATVVASVTGGTWSMCTPFPHSPTFPWTATIRGNAATSGANTVWTSSTVDNFGTDIAGFPHYGVTPVIHSFTDEESTQLTFVAATTRALRDASAPSGATPPTHGVYWSQPTAGTAPLCLVMSQAGPVAGALYSNMLIDAKYCFEGSATTWSLTN